MNKITFVLAGDYGYIRYIETTLKSICYHHENCKIYIINRDIPQEWFIGIRKKMEQKNSKLIDAKLLNCKVLTEWKLPPVGEHMNYMSFARYFIPQFVEEDIVLYLDSDTIVTRSLNELFEIEFGDNLLAAAKIVYGLDDKFNSGVLLVNNRLWKKENIQQKLIEVTNKEHENVAESDQSIFNMVVKKRYIVLDDTYNFQVGYDRIAEERKQYFILELSTDPLPAVIHYLSADKPWNIRSHCRLRSVWWKYSLMDWSEIIAHEIPLKTKSALIMTHSQELEQIETLVKQLPEYTFNIMALTLMGDRLNILRKYENVRLFPAILEWNMNRLLQECDVYLDINHGEKEQDVIEKARELGKPILSFENTLNPYFTTHIFSNNNPEEMLEYLKIKI